jgi:SAM-dependent methyltransferase
MPELGWNRDVWDRDYDWAAGGEEWSAGWGGSEPQWFGSLLPRIHHFLPAQRILEIAPGFGRWTKFLLRHCGELVGIDLSSECVQACRRYFAKAPNAVFHQNDGLSLAAAGSEPFDFIFSFDSLVHADNEVFVSYIPQILRLLTERGVAFIHHSNYSSSGANENKHFRSLNVNSGTVSRIIRESNGFVYVQEQVNWGSKELIDCFTLFGRRASSKVMVRLSNPDFMVEANSIKTFHAPYGAAVPSE